MSLPNSHDEQSERASVRKKMLLQGTIVYNRGLNTMDCAVFDLSDSGARLRPAEADMLPPNFELRVRAGGTYRCELVHRDGGQVGVRFVERDGG